MTLICDSRMIQQGEIRCLSLLECKAFTKYSSRLNPERDASLQVAVMKHFASIASRTNPKESLSCCSQILILRFFFFKFVFFDMNFH